MDLIRAAFPDLPEPVLEKLAAYAALLKEWNGKINLISRKDDANIEERHLLHSMAIVRVAEFGPRTRVIDVGTGGGLPGIPLAICFPKVQFTLVDATGKKVHAVGEMAGALGLENVTVLQARVESLSGRYEFVTGRAVTALPDFLRNVKNLLHAGGPPRQPHGVYYFKGTAYQEELAGMSLRPHRLYRLDKMFSREYFDGKFLIHLRAADILKRMPGARKTGNN